MPHLSDITRRGFTQQEKPIRRITTPEFFDEKLSISDRIKHPRVPYGTRDQSLAVQIQRGKLQSNPMERFLDHDRTDRLIVQEHGVKVRLAEPTVAELGKQSEKLNTDIQNAIQTANTAQIQALADAVGIPITNDIVKMRKTIENSFLEMLNLGIEPSAKRQAKILKVLKEIRDKGEDVDLDEFLAPETVESKTPSIPDIIDPSRFKKWVDDGLDNQNMKIIEDLYEKQTGNKVENKDKKQSSHKFILGPKGGLITIDAVKKNMATGNYLLNVKKFRLEKI